MASIATVKTMVDILVSQGLSSEEALQRVKESAYAREHEIDISDISSEQAGSLTSFINEFKGFKTLESELTALREQLNWHQALSGLRQEKEFLVAGWKVFQNIRWMSWIYLFMLTLLVFILDFFVGPAFEDVFSGFGAELPQVTTLYFASGNLALVLLSIIWLISVTYMVSISQFKRTLKGYRSLPSILFRLPLFTNIARVISRSVLLSKLHFLAQFKVCDIRQLTTDISKLGLSEKAPDFEQQKQLLNDLSLAMELGVTKQFIARELDEAFEHYIDVSTRSMRLLSIIGTLILGVMITSIIIAMYSPIFMFGSIF